MPLLLLPGTTAASLGLSRQDGACVHPFEQSKDSSKHGHWGGGTAGNVEIDRDHLGNTSNDRVAAGETSSVPRAVSDRDDPFGIGHRVIGALQCVAHVFGHRTNHHQHIGMARRGDEPEAEALDVVVSVVERVNPELAFIAGAGIDLAYRQTSAQTPPRGAANGCCEFGHRGIVGRRRRFGEGPAEQALKKQLGYLF